MSDSGKSLSPRQLVRAAAIVGFTAGVAITGFALWIGIQIGAAP